MSRTSRHTRRSTAARAWGLAALLLALVGGAGAQIEPEPESSADHALLAFTPVRDGSGFVRATPGRLLRFPADHASHPETRTEWWYLTGSLRAADGRQFGFQATWFRRALILELPAERSPLATRDVLLFHGALTDVAAGKLSFHEQSCRAYPSWAHAATDTLDVALLGSSLRVLDRGARTARLSCRAGDALLELDLDLAACTPLLHGAEPGLSIKGSEPGQASWYYSLPRIPVTGTLQRGAAGGAAALPGAVPGADASGERLSVSGSAWFDHEFGSSQLSAEQTGWDWFSVALDDGSELMLYRMRRADGSADAASSGSFRDASEPAGVPLARGDFALTETAAWTSPHTGARYPAGWRLLVPSQSLELDVQPLLADQELRTPGSTGVTYWEGLCRFTGTRAGRPVSGEGYVELVGYAGAFTERL